MIFLVIVLFLIVFFFLVSKKKSFDKQPVQPKPQLPVVELTKTQVQKIKLNLLPQYYEANQLWEVLSEVPYFDPLKAPAFIKNDKILMGCLEESFKHTSQQENGTYSQSTLTGQQRIELQKPFKEKIYSLLDECIFKISDHVPAMILYLRVTEFNSRAANREQIIKLYERFSESVDSVSTSSLSYQMVRQEIGTTIPNYSDLPERYIADFFVDYARILLKNKEYEKSIPQFERAGKWFPQLYGGISAEAFIEMGKYKMARLILQASLNLNIDENRMSRIKSDLEFLKGKKDKPITQVDDEDEG